MHIRILQVDPFDANSPIKQSAISRFPPDMFFVLRVVQLLRGLANGPFVAFVVQLHLILSISQIRLFFWLYALATHQSHRHLHLDHAFIYPPPLCAQAWA